MLKVNDEKITENPNQKNDMYKDYEYATGIDFVISIIIWLGVEVIFIWSSKHYIFDHIKFNRKTWIVYVILIMGHFVWIWCGSEQLRDAMKTKNTIKKGKKFMGIIVKNKREEEYVPSPHGATTRIVYVLTIQYADTIFQMRGSRWNPELVLENPYCDVYKYKKNVVATNFKVAEKYIKENGSAFDWAKAIDDTWAMK